MKALRVILTAALLTGVATVGLSCKKEPPKPDLAYHHSPQGIYDRINELRLQLTVALEKGELQYVHDNMYYFKDLLTVLSMKLEGEQKQRVDAVLRDLSQIADAIDNSAGRGNQSATEANLKQLIERLKELETEFKPSK